MKYVIRLLTGVVGAITGVIVFVLWELTLGDGLHLVPFQRFAGDATLAALAGFAVGAVLSRLICAVVNVAGRIDIDVP